MTQAMSVFVVIAYIYCKSPLFKSLTTDSIRTRDRIYLYLVFSCLSILGTYLGVPVHDAIANTRAIGPVLAGIIGGPILGTAVGFTGGLHRYFLGGFTALSCGLSTTLAGTIGGDGSFLSVSKEPFGTILQSEGRVHHRLLRGDRPDGHHSPPVPALCQCGKPGSR